MKKFLWFTSLGMGLLLVMPAFANIQSSRWFYKMQQEGTDLRITLQLIDTYEPNFDTTFTLTRGSGETGSHEIFANRVFTKEEADEVFGPGCIEESWMSAEECTTMPEACSDCDDDGTFECPGICGTAYRYEVLDACNPNDSTFYNLDDDQTPGEGEEYYYIHEPEPHEECEETIDECQNEIDEGDGDVNCSVSNVGGMNPDSITLLLLLGFGLCGLVFSLRGKKRRG